MQISINCTSSGLISPTDPSTTYSSNLCCTLLSMTMPTLTTTLVSTLLSIILSSLLPDLFAILYTLLSNLRLSILYTPFYTPLHTPPPIQLCTIFFTILVSPLTPENIGDCWGYLEARYDGIITIVISLSPRIPWISLNRNVRKYTLLPTLLTTLLSILLATLPSILSLTLLAILLYTLFCTLLFTLLPNLLTTFLITSLFCPINSGGFSPKYISPRLPRNLRQLRIPETVGHTWGDILMV